MSYQCINEAWKADLPPVPKLVLLSLADQANDDGYCWPGQQSIARRCGISTRSVRSNIKLLEDAGCIRRTHRPGDGAGRKSDLYLVIGGRKWSSEDTGEQGQPEDASAWGNRKMTTGNRKPASAKPSVDPSDTTTTPAREALILDDGLIDDAREANPNLSDADIRSAWAKFKHSKKATTAPNERELAYRWIGHCQTEYAGKTDAKRAANGSGPGRSDGRRETGYERQQRAAQRILDGG